MAKASNMSDCDFTRESGGWCCEGNGNLLGERSFGRGETKQAAYDDYRRTLRVELAGMIEDDADEAELVQQEIGDDITDEPHGTSIRDDLMARADVDAMRERAKRLRSESKAERIRIIEQRAEDGGTGGPVVQPCPCCGCDTVDPAYWDSLDETYGLTLGAEMNEAETAWLCWECVHDDEDVTPEDEDDDGSADMSRFNGCASPEDVQRVIDADE